MIAAPRQRDRGDSNMFAVAAQTRPAASLAGRGDSVAGYAPALQREARAADADASGLRWRQWNEEVDARWPPARPGRQIAAQQAGLRRSAARRELSHGGAELCSQPPALVADAADVP